MVTSNIQQPNYFMWVFIHPERGPQNRMELALLYQSGVCLGQRNQERHKIVVQYSQQTKLE
jgi:hypothetical protein